MDAELWFHLFMRTCWPPSGALLAFAEGTTTPVGIDWRARLQARAAAVPTIVVDVGRGYTKYTVADGIQGRWELDGCPPQIVQLCSSPTHPPDCERNDQLRYIQYLLNREFLLAAANPSHRLHRAALAPLSHLKAGSYAIWSDGEEHKPVKISSMDETTGTSKVEVLQKRITSTAETKNLAPIRQAQDLPILIGEPFAITAAGSGEKGSWEQNIRSQLGNDRPGAVQVVSQAQMALWAHGVDHGIVVNIGQGQTVALPVVKGEVVSQCALSSSVGSGDLTQVMVSLMARKHPAIVDSSLMTWCRDLKENYCYVSPPGRGCMRSRLAAGDDYGIRPVDVELPQYASARTEDNTLELAEERVLVPEVLFESNRGMGLPGIIVRCADAVLASGRTNEEGVRNLLRQVVLVGGAADFPGIRPRVEYEMRSLLQSSQFERLRACLDSAEDVFVLNPPRGEHGPLVTPRFVPLFGGCVRAASSKGYGAWERDSNVGALRSLPLLAEMPEGPVSSRQVFWQQRMRRMLALQLPDIFRTGGGGGEDDQVWQMLDDEDGVESESSNMDFGEQGESESQEFSPSSPSEWLGTEETEADPGHGRASSAGGRSKGKGKGKGTSGKGKGKSRARRTRLVWRPVQAE
ncbi:ARP2 [Symbiodinium pilosum]|uniref:ARP2 protein n=1 Tax=Symbiodinium pilosum TaxID=2952 RepID=A0A812PPF5_SYMPI|nr:ARP2 [Symbiodinium pilosum]